MRDLPSASRSIPCPGRRQRLARKLEQHAMKRGFVRHVCHSSSPIGSAFVIPRRGKRIRVCDWRPLPSRFSPSWKRTKRRISIFSPSLPTYSPIRSLIVRLGSRTHACSLSRLLVEFFQPALNDLLHHLLRFARRLRCIDLPFLLNQLRRQSSRWTHADSPPRSASRSPSPGSELGRLGDEVTLAIDFDHHPKLAAGMDI